MSYHDHSPVYHTLDKSNDADKPLLFVGIWALPSFKVCAITPGSLNDTNIKSVEWWKKIKEKVIKPSQDTVNADDVATPPASVALTAIMEDPPPSQGSTVYANDVAAPTAAEASTAIIEDLPTCTD